MYFNLQGGKASVIGFNASSNLACNISCGFICASSNKLFKSYEINFLETNTLPACYNRCPLSNIFFETISIVAVLMTTHCIFVTMYYCKNHTRTVDYMHVTVLHVMYPSSRDLTVSAFAIQIKNSKLASAAIAAICGGMAPCLFVGIFERYGKPCNSTPIKMTENYLPCYIKNSSRSNSLLYSKLSLSDHHCLNYLCMKVDYIDI